MKLLTTDIHLHTARRRRKDLFAIFRNHTLTLSFTLNFALLVLPSACNQLQTLHCKSFILFLINALERFKPTSTFHNFPSFSLNLVSFVYKALTSAKLRFIFCRLLSRSFKCNQKIADVAVSSPSLFSSIFCRLQTV